jgi:ribosome maturation factor RimP
MMPEEDLITRIEETVQPVLQGHGVELVDLDWRGHGPRGVLRLFIDKSGGVSIEDCERVSREVGDVLDVANLIGARYDLQVSSPGLDRTLRTEREYRWAVGKTLRCWLADGREVRGRLATVDPEQLTVDTEDGRVELPRADVRKARLEAEVPWPRESMKPRA